MSEGPKSSRTADLLYALFKDGRTRAEAIKLLGPPPSTYDSLTASGASWTYAEFLHGLVHGMGRKDCIALTSRGIQGALGEEGRRIAEHLIGIVVKNRVREIMDADQRRSLIEADFRTAINSELQALICRHGKMRRDGTLKAYLKAKL